MDSIKELLLVLFRVYTIYPLLLGVTLFMGRRSVGELPIFDYIIVLSLGSVIGADIADPKMDHLPTIFAIIAIAILQKIASVLLINNRRIGKWITFEPVIVIKDGRMLHKNLKKVRYSIDNILQMLRQNEIFDISDIDLAVLEANGKLSVLKRMDKSNVTLGDLNLTKNDAGLTYAVIKEGRMQTRTLEKLNLSADWLHKQLEEKGVQLHEVFFASMNGQLQLNITVYDHEITLPPLYH